MHCDCFDDGRDAYKREKYSYETQDRLERGRYYGDECDREFLDGYRYEERKEDDRRMEEELEMRRRTEIELSRQQEQECHDYEQQIQYEYEQYLRNLEDIRWADEHNPNQGI